MKIFFNPNVILVVMFIFYSAVIGGERISPEQERLPLVFSPVTGAKPPANAVVLLGKDNDLSWWRMKEEKNKKIKWRLQQGVLKITPDSGSIVTRRNVRDFYLHLEFMVPSQPGAAGQNKGNSGIYIQKRYEVQILDSYGIKDYTDQDCGALYKARKPDLNACRPAGRWQCYDIIFRAARWDKSGNKIDNVRITVVQNGKVIHNNVELVNKTGAGQKEAPNDGPILLQEHDNLVSFRNIWLIDLPEGEDVFCQYSRQLCGAAEKYEEAENTLSELLRHQGEKTAGVKISKLKDKLRVTVDGKLFTQYCFNNVPRPYFYPVVGPSGSVIIRHWPMKEGSGEQQDHPHHRSLWYAHGDMNGHDFWVESKDSGKIVHDKFLEVASGPKRGIIRSTNKWVARNGKVICTDSRTHTFRKQQDNYIMDFDVTIHACQGAVTMGDTKEGSMAIRVAPTLRLKGKVAGGHIVNSRGARDYETWGKRAAWCDYYGPLDGVTAGIAIFDHPGNPRHPTWWQVRPYGLFAANPFGLHSFERRPAGTGNLTIPAGESLTFRYRFYFHKGDEKQAQIEKMYREYAASLLEK